MNYLGDIVFFVAYRISFLVAKWRLAWSYWNNNGQYIGPVHFPPKGIR